MRLSEISDNDMRAAILPSLSQRRIVGYPRVSICEWLARQVAELRDNKSVYLRCKSSNIVPPLVRHAISSLHGISIYLAYCE